MEGILRLQAYIATPLLAKGQEEGRSGPDIGGALANGGGVGLTTKKPGRSGVCYCEANSLVFLRMYFN
jgi:hypothetical protein